MAIKPTQVPVVSGDQNRYSLVIAVAKLARQISEDASKREEILVEKPVDLAVRNMIDTRYCITPIEDEVAVVEEKEEIGETLFAENE